MSLSKTWYTSANLAIADSSTASKCAHSSIWGFAAMLLGNQSGTNGAEGARPGGAAWVLAGSSNSSTSGMDTTDRLHFAGSFTDADWVRNTAGSAHTWFVIQSPSGLLDGPWYFCFDYIGPTNDQTCTFVVAKNAFSGGSTTARPTATNEATFTSQQFCSTTQAAGKIHLTIDANGGFRWQRSRNGTGYFDFCINIEPVVEYHSGDQSRTFTYIHFLDSGSGAMSTQSSPQLKGLTSDGSAAIATNVAGLGEIQFRPGGTLLNSMTTTNAVDSTVDALPIGYVYDNTASHKGIRGRFPDMWDVGNQVSVGSTFPGSGNPERALVGGKMIAMSVAPSL